MTEREDQDGQGSQGKDLGGDPGTGENPSDLAGSESAAGRPGQPSEPAKRRETPEEKKPLVADVLDQARGKTELRHPLAVGIAALLLVLAIAVGVKVVFPSGSGETPSAAVAQGDRPVPSEPLPVLALVGPQGENVDGDVDWAPPLAVFQRYFNEQDSPLTSRVAPDYRNDQGHEAFIRRNALSICESEEVVAVVGYVWTSHVLAALDEYRDCGVPPPPLITIGVTGDSVTAMNDPDWHYPILQLAPSNLHQAKLITEALGDTFEEGENPRILILLDMSNPDYSRPLAGQIRTAVEAYKKMAPQWVEEDYYGGPWGNHIDGHQFNGEPPEVIIFIGNATKAMGLLSGRDPSDSLSANPIVIVTDGATNPTLLRPSAECVWGAFPSVPDDGFATPSFALFAEQALTLLDRMILEIPDSMLTRETLTESFREVTESNEWLDLPGFRIRFDGRGRVEQIRDDDSDYWHSLYHFSQVQRDPTGGLTLAHRERRYPLTRCTGS